MTINKMLQKTTALITMLIMIFSMSCNTSAEHRNYSNEDLELIMQDIIQWKKSDMGYNKNETMFGSDFVSLAGSPSADWYAIALGRMGASDNFSSYLSVLKNNVTEKYKTKHKLDSQKATEWHRISLAILSLGGDPKSISKNSIDLIADGTYNRELTVPLDAQGLNGLIWGLITLDSMAYTVPENVAKTRNEIIVGIIEKQHPNGCFSLNDNGSDPDLTAMAITALSPYYNSEEEYTINGKLIKARDCVDKALNYLSEHQSDNGGFIENDGTETLAQTIIALCSVGIDPVNDSRFIKNGNNLLDRMMTYQNSDGGFLHSLDDKNSSSMSGEQALLAIISLYRFQNDLRNLYDFRPELSSEQKKEISSIERQIANLTENQQQIQQTFEKYCKITPSERRYVNNYALLTKKMMKLGIENNSEYLSEAMDLNTSGSGTIIDIFSKKQTESNSDFNKNDYDQFLSLPEELTLKDYSTVVYLYDKLNNAKNKNDYKNIVDTLEDKRAELEAVQKQIESTNEKILNTLYPFDSVSLKDKNAVEAIYNEIKNLSDYDKALVLGYEDVLKARTKIENLQRTLIIEIIAFIVLAVMITTIIVRVKKRRSKKKENANFAENNEDW